MKEIHTNTPNTANLCSIQILAFFQYKLCLTTWKTLHTSQPLYLSELISHYLSSRSLRSSHTNLLTGPALLLASFPLRPFLCLHLLLGTLYLHTFVPSILYPPSNVTLNSISSSLPLPSSHSVPTPQIHSHDIGAICIGPMYVCIYVCY